MISFTSSVLAATALLASSAMAIPTSSPMIIATSPDTIQIGDLTFYDPNNGIGSCGRSLKNTDSVVALSLDYEKAQCNRTITIEYGGKNVSGVEIADSCVGCVGNSIDVTRVVFDQIADESVGRLHGVNWHYDP